MVLFRAERGWCCFARRLINGLPPANFYTLTSGGLAGELTSLRESEEKLKLQQQESTRRENVLVMRLATKEQEMQELLVRYLYGTINSFYNSAVAST